MKFILPGCLNEIIINSQNISNLWVLHLIGIEFYLYLNIVKDFLDIFPVDDIALILVSV